MDESPANRQGLGFIQAPRINPGTQKKSELPGWIKRIIESWRPQPVQASRKPSLSESFSQDYGSGAMDFTGRDVDGRLDELSQRILLDGAVCKQVCRLVRRSVKDGCVPVTFCAGRIPALGSISGHAMGKVEAGTLSVTDASSACLIWLDLFGNMDSRIASYLQYLTRCPAAFLLHELFPQKPKDLPGFEWIRPWLSVTRAAVIGLQDPSHNEIQFLEEKGIQYCTVDNLVSRGAEECITAALMAINPRNDLPVHLVINVFALDLTAAPDAPPEVGGKILVQDMLIVLDAVLHSGRLGAVDILEVDQVAPEEVARATEVINKVLKCVSAQVKRETVQMSFEL
ncbi:putative Arginase-1 [Hypsibius exemplaris]|uniref:Arginase-1 n=1 Tax=Hypsibius exemplaris TaxID=2072580 RepID=A0A1W0WAJ1_HYPEX|nr:putative Arginase-1 [Hypsibius exemplaris]